MKGAWWWTSVPRRSRRLPTRMPTPRLSTRSSPSACAAARTWVPPYLTSRFSWFRPVLFCSVRGACWRVLTSEACCFAFMWLGHHEASADADPALPGGTFCAHGVSCLFWLVQLIRQELWNFLLWICRLFWWPSSAHIVVRGNDMPNFLFIGICPGLRLVELLLANW